MRVTSKYEHRFSDEFEGNLQPVRHRFVYGLLENKVPSWSAALGQTSYS